jgi:hypothetical protein
MLGRLKGGQLRQRYALARHGGQAEKTPRKEVATYCIGSQPLRAGLSSVAPTGLGEFATARPESDGGEAG